MRTICKAEGCERYVKGLGLCSKHYQRFRLQDDYKPRVRATECRADNCERPVKALGLCGKHYMRFRQHGDYNREATVITNPLKVIKQYLSYEPETGLFRWTAKPNGRGHPYSIGDIAGGRMLNGYLVIQFKGGSWYAHRLAWWWIHGEMPERLDHRNRSRADNRIDNLRLATPAQNAANTTISAGRRFFGAYFRECRNKWQSAIRGGGRFVHLGYFDTEEEAARAYDAAAVSLRGEFANLNFPQEYCHGRAA